MIEFDKYHSKLDLLLKVPNKEQLINNVSKIDSLHEEFQNLVISAEAKLRILVHSLPALEMKDEFKLIENADQDNSFKPPWRLRKSVVNLISTLQTSLNKKVDFCFSETLNSGTSVEINFQNLSRQFVWIFNEPQLPWSGINLTAYLQSKKYSPVTEKRIFRVAHRALEYSIPVFNEE